MDIGSTFDDVCLVPQYSNIPSRHIPVVETWLTKQHRIGFPIIPSNMDTVVSPALAKIVCDLGGEVILPRHRFDDSLTNDYKYSADWLSEYPVCRYITWGVTDLEDLMQFLQRHHMDVAGVCLDIAHGHCEAMVKAIKIIREQYPPPFLDIIAGNVCTPLGYNDLVNAGADAVKVGVGCGAACTTRLVTGFGVPQFTAIYECGKLAKKLRVPIIADGGIRSSRDIVLALAAGASSVMVGKLFAATIESAAEKKNYPPPDGMMARYRGHASADYQVDFYGQCYHIPEGESFWTPVTGSAEKLITELVAGIRSGMSYGGAMDIKELQRKAEFMRVTNTYQEESRVRP